MTGETAEQVLTRVLARLSHQTPGPWRTHVAAELAAALREAGLLVEGETVTEWGVTCAVDDHGTVYRSATEENARDEANECEEGDDHIVSRQRTYYPDRVTDWEPVEGGESRG